MSRTPPSTNERVHRSAHPMTPRTRSSSWARSSKAARGAHQRLDPRNYPWSLIDLIRNIIRPPYRKYRADGIKRDMMLICTSVTHPANRVLDEARANLRQEESAPDLTFQLGIANCVARIHNSIKQRRAASAGPSQRRPAAPLGSVRSPSIDAHLLTMPASTGSATPVT